MSQGRGGSNRGFRLRDWLERFPCDYGCSEEAIPKMVDFCRRHIPDKRYCVIKRWIWIDLAWCKQAIIYANEIVDDEARRGDLATSLLSTYLQEFQQNCIFTTVNTNYILCAPGERSSMSFELYVQYAGLRLLI